MSNSISDGTNCVTYASDEDKDKLDFEASFSEEARNLNIYDMILANMGMSPASMELQKEKLGKGESQEDFDILDRGEKLATAATTGKFAKTKEGKAHRPLFQQMNIQALKGTYQSRNELRKKKR